MSIVAFGNTKRNTMPSRTGIYCSGERPPPRASDAVHVASFSVRNRVTDFTFG